MNFDPLFKPKTIAVIGVSLTNDSHPANVIYNKNRFRYQAKAFAVNPKGGNLLGEKVYRHISEIPEKADLALIAVRAEYVPQIMKDCIKAGVGGAVVISGGFAESGRKDLEDRLVSLARDANFPFIGPNCLGIYSPSAIDTLFLPSERIIRPDAGDVAFVSQSGGILVDQMLKFSLEGIGLSVGVSIGNKALIKEIDLLNYLAKDPNTRVIAFYIEGFEKKKGREFVVAASRCPKPVVILKAGKSPGGIKAVSSHTASLAGDYEVFQAVFSQYGIILARNELELVSFCEALSCYTQSIQGRMGIVTGSGGHGALAVDMCADYGLSVPDFDLNAQNEIKERLSVHIKDIASLSNPVDLTGSAVDEDFVNTVALMGKMPEIDCIMVLLLPYLPGISSDLGAKLSYAYQRSGKNIIAYVPHVEKYRMLIEGFELNRIPVAHSIEEAVQMAEAIRRRRPC